MNKVSNKSLEGSGRSSVFVENPKIDDIESTALRDFLDIWLSLYTDDELPRTRRLSLPLFGLHLPYMVQHKYHRESDRFQVKYFGSGYADGVGADHTNRYVDEIPNSASLLTRCSWLVENRQPYLSMYNEVTWSPHDFKHYDVLACPLFDDDDQVSSVVFRIEFV